MTASGWDFAAFIECQVLQFATPSEVERFSADLAGRLSAPVREVRDLAVTAVSGQRRLVPYSYALIRPARVLAVGDALRLVCAAERPEVVATWPVEAEREAACSRDAFWSGRQRFSAPRRLLIDRSTARPGAERMQGLCPERFPLVDAVAMEMRDVRVTPGEPAARYEARWEIPGLGLTVGISPPPTPFEELVAQLSCSTEGGCYEDLDQGYTIEFGRLGDTVWVLWGSGPDGVPARYLPDPAYHPDCRCAETKPTEPSGWDSRRRRPSQPRRSESCVDGREAADEA